MESRTATPLYKGMTQDDIEAQYFLRGTRPDYQSKMIPDWIEDRPASGMRRNVRSISATARVRATAWISFPREQR